jgi:hypothetical protein
MELIIIVKKVFYPPLTATLSLAGGRGDKRKEFLATAIRPEIIPP